MNWRAGMKILWSIALLTIGALVLAAPWSSLKVSLILVAAAVLPLALLRGALRLGLSRWAATSLLVLLIVMVAYLLTASGGLSLQDTVRDVVPRLLTAPLPYAAEAELLAGPLVLAALVSLLVGLRVDSHARVEPVLGALVLYLAGALLTAGEADPWGLAAALLLVVAILGWVLHDEHAELLRPRLVVAAPLAALSAVALALVATLPLQQPFQPRDLVDPPVYDVAMSNPLAQLSAWGQNPEARLFYVSGPEVPMRLAVLDTYNGEQWTASTRYQQFSADQGDGLPGAGFRQRATVRVQVDGLGGNWLPTPGQPVAVGTDALIDPGTGTLYAPRGSEGLAYEVTGTYDSPPQESLPGGVLGQERLERYTRLPPVDPWVVSYAGAVVRNSFTPYDQAVALENRLREVYELDSNATSGSALWRLRNFLVGADGEDGARVGTSEQFASAFALIARQLGLPTRVVVGFKAGDELDDGSREVQGKHALAWAEVYFENLGWVPFSPTPDDDTFSRPDPVEVIEPDLPDDEATEPVPTPAGGGGETDDETDDDAAPGASSTNSAASPYLLVGGGVLVLIGALGLLRWLRRQGQRRRGALGAWAEVVDSLRLAGSPPPDHQTADLVAASADRRWSTSVVTEIATAADRAAFAPEPSSAPRLNAQVRSVRRLSRRSLPWWRRWWWHLDPRVLRRPRTGNGLTP